MNVGGFATLKTEYNPKFVMKKTLVILGHPDTESYCGYLADRYAAGVEEAGAPLRRINLGELDFDPVLHKGYKEIQPLEPDLERAQDDILWADHLVWVYPMWWGGMPAVMKGFIDRAFLPSFSFKFKDETSYQWKGLLKGRSARLLITMDGPPLAIRLLFQDPAIGSMKGMTLGFCGVDPVRVSQFGSVKRATKARKILWRMEVEDLGRKQL